MYGNIQRRFENRLEKWTSDYDHKRFLQPKTFPFFDVVELSRYLENCFLQIRMSCTAPDLQQEMSPFSAIHEENQNLKKRNKYVTKVKKINTYLVHDNYIDYIGPNLPI